MCNKLNFIKKSIWGLLLLGFCIILPACNQEETRPFSLSEYAVEYSFPQDNILGLISVMEDSTDTESRFILEFSAFSISKSGIETIIKEMEEDSSGYSRRIVVKSDENVTFTKAEVMDSKYSVFLILHFPPQVACSQVEIHQGSRSMYLEGPWERPTLLMMDSIYIQDGAEGTLFSQQEYDKENKKWMECIENFAEDQPPVCD